jgi:hypothetical protein
MIKSLRVPEVTVGALGLCASVCLFYVVLFCAPSVNAQQGQFGRSPQNRPSQHKASADGWIRRARIETADLPL